MKKNSKPQTRSKTKEKQLSEKKYFGLTIHSRKYRDAELMHFGAMLFLCPDISSDHAKHFIDRFEKEEFSLERINKVTANGIQEVVDNKNALPKRMTEKIKEWFDAFGELTTADYDYINEHYGILQDELLASIHKSCSFKSPKELYAAARQYIIGQDEALEKMAVMFFLQSMCRDKNIDTIARSMLSIGPTGCGKSESFRRMGMICGLPVLIVNSSHFTALGWKGPNLSDLILQFMITNGYQPQDLKYLVLVITEFDKIAHHGNRIVSDGGTDGDHDQMRQVMDLLDKGNHMMLENGIDRMSGSVNNVRICTDNWLVVLDGAFEGMGEIIKKRLQLQDTIGFSKATIEQKTHKNILKHIEPDDLVQWGFLTELVGRITQICVLNPITKEVAYQILTEAKESELQRHINICKLTNIDLKFTEGALMTVADYIAHNKYGFRSAEKALTNIMEPVYLEHLSKIAKPNSTKVVVDEILVNQQLNIK